MVHFDSLSRRFFLRTAGATVALPFLESLLPSRSEAQVSPPPAVISIAIRNGQFVRDFATHTPAAALQAVSDSTQPWATVRAAPLTSAPTGGVNDVFTSAIVGSYLGDFLHLDGLDHVNPLGHNDAQLGGVGGSPSFDQVAARVLSTRASSGAPVPSLEINNPSPYQARTSSFRRESDGRLSQLPALVQPAALFDRLFSMSQPAVRASAQRSLDAASNEADRLRTQVLSRTDADLLGRYVQALRDASGRLAARPPLTCSPGQRPPDGVTNLTQLAELQTSLAALAVSCGVSVVSFSIYTAMLPDGRTYDSQWWHNESHSEAPSVPTFLQAQQWVASAYFMSMVRKLDALGVWSRSVVFMNNDIKSGKLHNNENQPVMLAVGSQVSTFRRRGLYVNFQRPQSGFTVPQTADFAGLLINQLFNTLLEAQGLTAAEYATAGSGFGATAFATPERRARYAAVLPGAGLRLPYLS